MTDFATHTVRIIHRLGQSVTVGTLAVLGIFSNGYADAFGIVAGTEPNLLVATIDVPGVVEGTAVVVGAASYTVSCVKPDGDGLTRLILESA